MNPGRWPTIHIDMNPVNWFEIPTSDLDRAKTFYETVIGVELNRQDVMGLPMAWFPMTPGAAGSSGALIQQEDYVPSHEGSLVYLSVDDVAAALDRVRSAGGKVITEKMSIGEYGFVGHFEDSEGNRVGLHSNG